MGREITAGSLRAQLREAIHECVCLNERLECVLHLPSSHLPGEIRHGKVSAAPVPWYTTAAYLITDLHAESRGMESRLRLVAGHPVRKRGGSGDNTYKALEGVMSVSWAVDDGRVMECTRWLRKWCGQARIALGEKDAPRKLEPGCPYCQERTLWFWALSGVVRCINPACFADNGKKPQAHMEFSKVAGDFVLVWVDGSVGVPV
jgi:hypothetical protein